MIPAYLALSSPRASFSQCDAPSSSSSAERSLKHRTRIINYRGQSDERSMREQALSFSIPVPEKPVPTERTRENGWVARNNCENVCGYSKEIDSARRNVAFILGKCRRLYILNGKSAWSRNDSIKKSS